MPPIIRFDRNAVLSAALELTRKDGLAALNARAVAREMGSSTQPIFRLFSGMEELKADVITLIQQECLQFIQLYTGTFESPFMSFAYAYIMFARYKPEFFKILFMSDRICDNDLSLCDPCFDEAHIEHMQVQLGFEREKTIRAMHWIWTFTHGMAVATATKYGSHTDDQIKNILACAFETVKQQMDRSLH